MVDYHKQALNHIKLEQLDLAIECYIKLIEINPTTIYLRELGDLYEKKGLFMKAISECYIIILKTEPNNGVILNQIGVCYFNSSQFKLAIHYFNKVIKIKEISDVYCNIGLCHVNIKDYSGAENIFLKAFKIDKKNVKCLSSLGELYYFKKEYNKSIQFYYQISNMTDYHIYNASFSYLAKKDFKHGFKLYETRLNFNNINPQTNLKDRLDLPSIPYWNGKDICNKLLIIAEQGLGDNIQYYRFIIQLAMCYPLMKIFYFCKKEISHIFKQYENINIIDNVILLNYDFKIYIMSLPFFLNIKSIEPVKENYIITNESKLTFWRETFSPLKKLKVGFCYNGLLSSFIEKYIPLSEFSKLGGGDSNIDLICIHKQSDIIEKMDNINYYNIDVDKPFEDTIAILQSIDLLITIDTFIVHLAGILKIKTWLLLGNYSEWRWSDDLNKTYWYESVEIIRGDLTTMLNKEVRLKLA
jgi:tetratricopeptide (TPR) repeat protein